MSTTGHSRYQRVRAGVAAAVAASLLAIGVGVLPAGAATTREAAPSAFCHTIMTYHPTQPKGTSYTSYQKWAKTYLPFWQKLAGEAPNAKVKNTLNELVAIIKYDATSKSAALIGAYMASHQKAWLNGWKAVVAAIVSCASSYY
ncbi:MAG: hypothetical protein KGJ36_07365 [Acidobacteriota bacterium]|nr:hypothetical protein [Acidobacteriota bacterium]